MGKQFNSVRGEKHWCSKLTVNKVRAMRNLHYKKGVCIKCTATLYNVAYPTAWDAINYVTWKQVGD